MSYNFLVLADDLSGLSLIENVEIWFYSESKVIELVKEDSSLWKIISIVSTSSTLIIFMILFICYVYKKKRSKSTKSKEKIESDQIE